jgi:hypothetical protein
MLKKDAIYWARGYRRKLAIGQARDPLRLLTVYLLSSSVVIVVVVDVVVYCLSRLMSLSVSGDTVLILESGIKTPAKTVLKRHLMSISLQYQYTITRSNRDSTSHIMASAAAVSTNISRSPLRDEEDVSEGFTGAIKEATPPAQDDDDDEDIARSRRRPAAISSMGGNAEVTPFSTEAVDPLPDVDDDAGLFGDDDDEDVLPEMG